MSSSSLPPPGWYGDPAGTAGSRWWNGTTWTDHVRAAPPNDDPPPPPGARDAHPYPTDAALPLSMSRRARATVVVAAVALLVGVAATTVIGLRSGDPPASDRPLGQVRPDADVPAPLDAGEVAARTEAAGCTRTAGGEPLEERTHLDPADAPPPDALYPRRPAHSGPHYGGVLPLPRDTASRPIDERAVLHNMEHGAVVVWFDAAALADADQRAVRQWRDDRADLGFTSPAGGAVFASPIPRIDEPPAVALRAWGVALDCERFDPVVADAFLVDHWGSHGAAPEAGLSPFPDGSLGSS